MKAVHILSESYPGENFLSFLMVLCKLSNEK